MRPAATSRVTCSRLIWLQRLFGPRGVYRCRNECSSNAFRMPSIQPQHKTTSSACAGVTDARRDDFLWILIHTSGSVSWCAASHVWNAASLSNVLIRRGSGTTGAMIHDPYHDPPGGGAAEPSDQRRTGIMSTVGSIGLPFTPTIGDPSRPAPQAAACPGATKNITCGSH